jgi:VWFA-related protein
MATGPFSRPSGNLPRTLWFALLGGIFSYPGLTVTRAQTPSATSQAPQAPPADTSQNAPKPDAKPTNDEIVSHDSPATFKVRVNVVLVRVVARDSNGKVITNLKKEDFQLADDRKPQIISSFSVETPASHAPTAGSAEATSEGTTVKAADLPQRFVTLFFDDLHLSMQDAMFSRQAAAKLFASMEARDRFSIFTTSGQVEQDFTGDRGKLEEAVQRILPHSLAQNSLSGCPPMTLDEAFMIAAAADPTAMQVAIQDYMNCSGMPVGAAGSQAGANMAASEAVTAANMVSAAANAVLNIAEAEEQRTYQTLQALIRRMSVLPGQRVVVMMSPGFYLLPSMHQPAAEVVDRATKENVVINAIDARGLYVSSVYDASNAPTTAAVNPLKTISIMREEETHFTPLAELADGTGGVFFHDRNDIDQGLLQAAGEPEVSYVLGFTPQNLKLDGKYHNLKVTLVNKEKWALQARHGYFAPRGDSDPALAAREEIQQAVFSQEELHELPVECQAQFFKGADGVHLSVVTHVGMGELRFRKADGRNEDTLTITTAIFDENGSMLAGVQRVLEMRLKDATLERVNKTGLNVKLSFDLQPGTFLVRTVVRDSEGTQMGATNRGVVIP